MERTFFVHFGVNTFNGVEWGSGREDPAVFCPSELDAAQWVRAVKQAGGRMLILVCKHHDGFCLWPSRYTAHSVAASPWLGGQGDEVRAVAKAAREQGIKLGVYLSPADLYQLATNPKNQAGYYGDGSKPQVSVIPTDPASFLNNPLRGRTPPAGLPVFTYSVDDYNRYFLNQLYELLTDYGPVAEVWFDGANPDPSVKETYAYAAWYDLIRKLQPGAIIFGKGPDARWVGNENGVARASEWSVIALPESPDAFRWPDMTVEDLGSRARLVPGSHLWWYPAEVDVPILNGWFWSADKHVKGIRELVDIFYTSVGRNGNLLLNLSPDRRGIVPADQLDVLHAATRVLDATFAKNLAEGGRVSADSSAPSHDALQVQDGDLDTWWEAAPGRTTATLILEWGTPVTFDVVSLQEAVDERGQRIENFHVETGEGTAWTAIGEGTTVGHKRLLRLSTPVTTTRLRLCITGSRLEPSLAEIGLFKQSTEGLPPEIGARDREGRVKIAEMPGQSLVYTLDGTKPTAASPVYSGALQLPDGGTVRAAYRNAGGILSAEAVRDFSGIVPAGWKIVGEHGDLALEEGSSSRAIDGDPATLWSSTTGTGRALTVDMGRERLLGGFVYLPRQDGQTGGTVERYRLETSNDGLHWTVSIADGVFANIRNNPVLQTVTFSPVAARYFRFTSLREIDGRDCLRAAEISVLPGEQAALKRGD